MVQTGAGQPNWPENLEKDLTQDKPDSINGYTIGDNTHKNISRYPWRMDDEKVAYKGDELALKHGIKEHLRAQGPGRAGR